MPKHKVYGGPEITTVPQDVKNMARNLRQSRTPEREGKRNYFPRSPAMSSGKGGKPIDSPILRHMAAWYRHNKGIVSSGGTVSQWNDASGFGRHLLQATADNRPVDGSVGSELITNGGFGADTSWSKGTGWTIGSGVASCDGTQTATTNLTQAGVVEAGKTYLVTFEVSNYSAGNVHTRTGGVNGVDRSANGTYNDVVVSVGAGVSAQADADFVGDIDNVSVKEITPDGTVYFPGVDEYLKAAAFTLNQPTTVYLLFKQITWTSNDRIFAGNSAVTRVFARQFTATPQIQIGAATAVANNAGLALDTYGVGAFVINGASSSITINNGTPTTGDPGSNNMGGFTLGAAPDPTAYSNTQVAEVIIYNVAHDAIKRRRVYDYFKREFPHYNL